MGSKLQRTMGPKWSTSGSSVAMRLSEWEGISLAWISGQTALCPRCLKRPSVVSEHVGETVLCSQCFVTEKGYTS
jgi:hypothetical protein